MSDDLLQTSDPKHFEKYKLRNITRDIETISGIHPSLNLQQEHRSLHGLYLTLRRNVKTLPEPQQEKAHQSWYLLCARIREQIRKPRRSLSSRPSRPTGTSPSKSNLLLAPTASTHIGGTNQRGASAQTQQMRKYHHLFCNQEIRVPFWTSNKPWFRTAKSLGRHRPYSISTSKCRLPQPAIPRGPSPLMGLGCSWLPFQGTTTSHLNQSLRILQRIFRV